MKKHYFAVLLVASLLSGCSDFDSSEKDDVVNVAHNFEYVQDKYGICYAISLFGDPSVSASSFSHAITTVPCEKLPEFVSKGQGGSDVN